MTNKPHHPARRNATRKAPGRPLGDDAQSPQRPEPIGDLLDRGLDELTEANAAVTASLAAEIARVRTPLAAELALCEVFRMMGTAAPESAGEQERLDASTDLLGKVITHAESMSSPAALALLRVCASLGPDVTRGAAEAAAARVAAAGVADPPWAGTIGRPDLLRAWHYGDIFGSQASIGAIFTYRGRDHLLMVLIDHGLGGGVKDCWVAEGRRARKIRDEISTLMANTESAYFENIDAATCADLLGAALDARPCPAQDDQIEDVHAYTHLTRSRADHLARLAAT